MSGYVYRLGDAIISWNSKKQHTIAASSTEAEYMSLLHGAKQALWLCQFLCDTGIHPPESPLVGTELFVDNTGAIALAKEAHFHARTKHIDVHYHFMRECVKDGTFEITHIPTGEMLTDGLTKALLHAGHENMAKRLVLMKV